LPTEGNDPRINLRAGKLPTKDQLVNPAKLFDAYSSLVPDPAIAAQRVAFGTSGHRGSSFTRSFNESHVLAISQAICHYRRQAGTTGPLFIGCDTHALSQPAFESALEVLSANAVEVMISAGGEYTPTPAVSQAILVYNKARSSGLADGIVITPSHNPPEDGGFKYNPTHGGPAESNVTGWIEKEANRLLTEGLTSVKRLPYARAKHAATTHAYDFLEAYTADLGSVLDWRRRRTLLGSYRRAVSYRSQGRQRAGRFDLRLHDPRLGWPYPHGSLLVLRDAPSGRLEGQV